MLSGVVTMMLPSDAGFGGWSVAEGVVLGTLFLSKLIFSAGAHKNLPPGPLALPVIGSLYLLRKHPYADLAKLAQTYGPVMSFWFGQKRALIVSSPAAAEEVLRTQGHNFSSRPKCSIGEILCQPVDADIVMSAQTPTSIHLKKTVHMHLSTTKQLQVSQSLRSEEIDHLLRVIPRDGTTVILVRTYLDLVVTNILSRLILKKPMMAVAGEKGEGLNLEEMREFRRLSEEIVHCVMNERLGDFIPVIWWIDIQGLRKRLQNLKTRLDAFMSRIVAEHLVTLMSASSVEKDLADVLLDQMEDKTLKVNITDGHVKCVLMTALVAGTGTTIDLIEWVMAECIHNPHVMNQVQAELDAVVGKSRRVEESDIPNLKYLQAIIKETFRLHEGPLIPHENMTACKVFGYDIPAETMVMVNTWAISRDPSIWEDPLKFKPERFLEGMPNAHIDGQGNHFEFLPFGSGRRACAGMALGNVMVHLLSATLLQCFEWSLPGGLPPEDLDMSAVSGMVPFRAQRLSAIPKTRLPIPPFVK